MSRAVIRSDSADSANFADPAAVAVAVSVSGLVPDLVDVLLSLVLLTGAVLHSLDLGSSAHLLLVYLFYFPVLLFLNETVLALLTFCPFLYPAVLRILYRPVEKQVRWRISM